MISQLDVARSRGILARWCALAERRLEYLTELFETDRWRRYYAESAFLEEVREAKKAVEAWRELLSLGASDSKSIDVSWLGRPRTPMPEGDLWRNPVRPAKATEITPDAGKPVSIVAEESGAGAGDVLSVQATVEAATALASQLTTIAQRYPSLYNTL